MTAKGKSQIHQAGKKLRSALSEFEAIIGSEQAEKDRKQTKERKETIEQIKNLIQSLS